MPYCEENFDILVSSMGGVGSTMIMEFLSKYKKINRTRFMPGTSPYKHSFYPPDIKCKKAIFIYGDPVESYLSLWDRKIVKCHIKNIGFDENIIEFDKNEISNGKKNYWIGDISLNKLIKLGDIYKLKKMINNWERGHENYKIMMIRYEKMWDNLDKIFNFLDISLKEIKNFPEYKKRKEKKLLVSSENLKKIDDIYLETKRYIDNMDDIVLIEKDKKICTVFRGISYSDDYKTNWSKKKGVDFERCLNTFFDKVVKPLNNYKFDYYFITYDNKKKEKLINILNPKEYIILDEKIYPSKGCLENTICVSNQIKKIFRKINIEEYDYFLITRFDLFYIKKITELNFKPNLFNFSSYSDDIKNNDIDDNFYFLPKKYINTFINAMDILIEEKIISHYIMNVLLRSICKENFNFLYQRDQKIKYNKDKKFFKFFREL